MKDQSLEAAFKEALVVLFLDMGVERATQDMREKRGLKASTADEGEACDAAFLASDEWDKIEVLHEIDERAGTLMNDFGCAASMLRSFMPIDMRGRTVQRLIRENDLSNLARLLNAVN